MARIDTLEHFLTDVADAIREKKGSQESIFANDFDNEIENLPSGIDLNDYFDTTITSNTSTNLNNSLLIQLVKKIPSLSLNNNITSLSGAFAYFKGDIPPFIDNCNNITDMNTMFFASNIKTIPLIDTSNVTNMQGMFMHCGSLETIPQIDTSKVTNMTNMFCIDNIRGFTKSSLISLPALDASSAINIQYVLSGSASKNDFTTFGGFINLGEAYLTSASANYSAYTLNLYYCSALTYESLMNVINNLYDIATKGCNTQNVILGSSHLAKLKASDIAIATDKGWTLS